MSGIYIIRNIENNMVYVGSTCREFKRRKYKHFSDLRRGKHCNPHLQNAYNKYGADSFVFEIVFICENEEELEAKELEIYSQYDRSQRYNIKEPTSRFGGRIPKETREKIRKTLLKNPPFKGRKHTKESKKMMSEAKKGEKSILFGCATEDHPAYGFKHTEETKKIWSRQRSGVLNGNYGKHGKDNFMSKPVKQIDIETGEVISVWESVTEASLGLFGNKQYVPNISRCAAKNPRYKTCKGFIWEYVE